MTRTNPYKLYDFYTAEDGERQLFFGREPETSRVVGDILGSKLLVLFARSGSGKTSILNAGIGPALREVGRISDDDPGIRMVTIRLSKDRTPEESALDALHEAVPESRSEKLESLHETLRRLCAYPKPEPKTERASDEEDKPPPMGIVLVFDQFEELFVSIYKDQPKVRAAFARKLAEIIHDGTLRAYVVLSLRSDHFHQLAEFREVIPTIFQNNANLELRPFDRKTAEKVILGPSMRPDAGFSWHEDLPERIAKDLEALNEEGDGVLPIQLQIVCYDLWERLKDGEGQITLAHYKSALKGAKPGESPAAAIIRQRILGPLEESSQKRRDLIRIQRRDLLRTLHLLITSQQTKEVRSLESLVAASKSRRRLMPILEDLESAQLLRSDPAYELRHDYLARVITPWLRDQDERLRSRDRNWVIAAAVLLITCAALITWLVMDFTTYEAHLSGGTGGELVISRRPALGFMEPDVWKRRITTGFFRPQLLDGRVEDLNFSAPHALSDWKSIGTHLQSEPRSSLDLATRAYEQELSSDYAPFLFEALLHRDFYLYAMVDERLFKFLLHAMSSGDLRQKAQAAETLGRTAPMWTEAGKDVPKIITALREVLKDASDEVRAAGASGMLQAAPYLDSAAVDEVVGYVKTGVSPVGIRPGPFGRVYSLLFQNVPLLQPAVRANLVAVLAKRRSEARSESVDLNLLATLARSPESDIQSAAIAALTERAAAKESRASGLAIQMLGGVIAPSSAAGARPVLWEKLESADWEIKGAAGFALARIDVAHESGMRKLVGEMRRVLRDLDSSPFAKVLAARALSVLSERSGNPVVREALPELRMAIRSGDLSVKDAAIAALVALSLKSDEALVREAIEALRKRAQVREDPNVVRLLIPLVKHLDVALAEVLLRHTYSQSDVERFLRGSAVENSQNLIASLPREVVRDVRTRLSNAFTSGEVDVVRSPGAPSVTVALVQLTLAENDPEAIKEVMNLARSTATTSSNSLFLRAQGAIALRLFARSDSFNEHTAKDVAEELVDLLAVQNLQLEAVEAVQGLARKIDDKAREKVISGLRKLVKSTSTFVQVKERAVQTLGIYAQFLSERDAEDILSEVRAALEANLKEGPFLSGPLTATAITNLAAQMSAEHAGSAFLVLRGQFLLPDGLRSLKSPEKWSQSDDELLRWLQTDDSNRIAFAVQILAKRDNPRPETTRALENLRHDSRPWVKMAALDCLVEMQRERFARIYKKNPQLPRPDSYYFM